MADIMSSKAYIFGKFSGLIKFVVIYLKSHHFRFSQD